MKKLLLVLMLLSLMACKKDDNFPDYLIGTWSDVLFADDVITSECQLNFSKVSDDQIKMKVLTEKYAGDEFILNIERGHDGMPIYKQTFSNNGLVVVEGEGHRNEPGFTITISRNNINVQYMK